MADKATMRAVKAHLQGIIDLEWPEATRLALDMNAKLALPDWDALEEDTVNDPDTGSLPEYLPDWDLPDAEAAARNGVTEQMVNAVKIALESKGIQLKYPSDPKYHGGGWHNVGSGPLPADWEERIRTGQPLS